MRDAPATRAAGVVNHARRRAIWARVGGARSPGRSRPDVGAQRPSAPAVR